MTEQRKTYTREFKLEAIQLWQTTEKSAREVKDDLDIAPLWTRSPVSTLMPAMRRCEKMPRSAMLQC